MIVIGFPITGFKEPKKDGNNFWKEVNKERVLAEDSKKTGPASLLSEFYNIYKNSQQCQVNPNS